MENHLASPFQGKNQQKRDGLKFSLVGHPARHVNEPAYLPASPEATLRGSQNTSYSPEASALGSRTQADLQQHHRLV
jgi:hypothetical protein